MMVSTQWLLRASVIYARYSENISLDDIALSSSLAASLIKDLPREKRFHLIVDVSHSRDYPRSVRFIRQAMDLAVFSRIDWFVFIANDVFQLHLAQVICQLFGMRLQLCDNVLEAYRFLQERAQVLPPQDWPDNINDTMPQR